MERKQRHATYLGSTLSTCPSCLDLVKTKILVKNHEVYFQKFCPDHGYSHALVSEDVDYYLSLKEFARPGSIPHSFSTETHKGCPLDCGLCPDHEQHTCHPIVEITDHCNLDCPICMADNQKRGFLSPSKFSGIVENLIKTEGSLENITLSGGEPSLHPAFWELTAIANRPEISRISLVTNGLRIAEDRKFCRQLKEENIYVILQWDGFENRSYNALRGAELVDLKNKALQNLEKYDIACQLIFVAARGINEHQLGRTLRLVLEKDFILSLVIQPVAYPTAPHASGSLDDRVSGFDPLNRITIPGVIKALAEQTPELVKPGDFFPLPCSHPECVSLTYMLRLDDGRYIPFPRFVDMKKYLHLLSQSATLSPSMETEQALHEIINHLWSMAGEIPDSDSITQALRRATHEIFNKTGADSRQTLKVSEKQAKSIFIHHYMDVYNFDLARVIKCCHHYPQPDGRIMPICSHNLFHRSKGDNPFDAEG